MKEFCQGPFFPINRVYLLKLFEANTTIKAFLITQVKFVKTGKGDAPEMKDAYFEKYLIINTSSTIIINSQQSTTKHLFR
jgi:hypothetical protein